MLRAIMDISARATSLTDRPRRAIWVTSVRMRREDRSSILSYPLADLGWKLLIGLRHRLLVISRSSFVRAKGPFHRPDPQNVDDGLKLPDLLIDEIEVLVAYPPRSARG